MIFKRQIYLYQKLYFLLDDKIQAKKKPPVMTVYEDV